MIKSYICTAHLRIIRQLNCTIRALRWGVENLLKSRFLESTQKSVLKKFLTPAPYLSKFYSRWVIQKGLSCVSGLVNLRK